MAGAAVAVEAEESLLSADCAAVLTTPVAPLVTFSRSSLTFACVM